MELELSPEQPEPVADAIETLVAPAPRQPDPWWQAGVAEALVDET